MRIDWKHATGISQHIVIQPTGSPETHQFPGLLSLMGNLGVKKKN
jgi:hypothetical protein